MLMTARISIMIVATINFQKISQKLLPSVSLLVLVRIVSSIFPTVEEVSLDSELAILAVVVTLEVVHRTRSSQQQIWHISSHFSSRSLPRSHSSEHFTQSSMYGTVGSGVRQQPQGNVSFPLSSKKKSTRLRRLEIRERTCSSTQEAGSFTHKGSLSSRQLFCAATLLKANNGTNKISRFLE